MSEHLTTKRLEQFLARNLSTEELLSIDDHVSKCEVCRECLFKLTDHLYPFSVKIFDRNKKFSQVVSHKESPFLLPRFALRFATAAVIIIAIVIVTLIISRKPITNGIAKQNNNLPFTVNSPSNISASPANESVTGQTANSNSKPDKQISRIETTRQKSTEQVNQNTHNANKQTDSANQLTASNLDTLKFPKELNRVMRSELLTLKGPASENEFNVTTPIRTFVKDSQPTFVWEKVQDAVRYEISVRALKGTKTIINESTTTNTYKPSIGTLDLYRGQVLMWSVAAYMPDGTSISAPSGTDPEALFIILDNKKVTKLETNLQEAKGNHLARGVVYANSGLLDDAESEFRTYLKLHPESKKAHALLLQVQSWRKVKKATKGSR